MRKLIFIITVFLAAMLPISKAAAQHWQPCQPLPESMMPATVALNGKNGLCQAVVIKDRIYTILSDDAGHLTEYDPLTNMWTEIIELSPPIMDFCKNVVNDELYMIGGHYTFNMDSPNKMIKFDPVTYSQVSISSNSLANSGTTEIEGTIFVLGGFLINGTLTNSVSKIDTKIFSPVSTH